MKKLIFALLLFILVVAAIGTWIFLGPATGFNTKKEALYIRSTAATKSAVLDSLTQNKIVSHKGMFEWLASRMDLWNHIKPGKYEISRGSSLLTIIRTLR